MFSIPRSASATSASTSRRMRAVVSSQGPISCSGLAPTTPRATPDGSASSGLGSAALVPTLSARRLGRVPYSPGGLSGPTMVDDSAASCTARTPTRGSVRRPSPSMVMAGSSMRSAFAVDSMPTESELNRLSISTNRPESGKFDQSVLAVVWTSTSQPSPRRSAVTSGVPSTRCAQVFSGRSRVGSARTWRWITTSRGMDRPAKGLASGKGAMRAGSAQLMVPSRLRPPVRSRTGTSPSAFSASFGPAKRTSTPPFSIQSLSRNWSPATRRPKSGSIRMDRGVSSRSLTMPSLISAKGSSARLR